MCPTRTGSGLYHRVNTSGPASNDDVGGKKQRHYFFWQGYFIICPDNVIYWHVKGKSVQYIAGSCSSHFDHYFSFEWQIPIVTYVETKCIQHDLLLSWQQWSDFMWPALMQAKCVLRDEVWDTFGRVHCLCRAVNTSYNNDIVLIKAKQSTTHTT